ncbi:MAG: hydrolase [Lachnospiraceae bacterium]|nr:hydrolase [Lachnospiraceae bacterium]
MRISADETICLIIDYQEKILPAMAEKEQLVETSVKLLKGLRILEVPMVMTTQYSKGLGLNIPEICEAAGIEEYIDKGSFSCADVEEVCHALLGKKNVIICGIEAHVCVLQTIIDLKEMGYQPILVEDCVSSRNLHDKEIALLRARDEGAILTTYESLLFELTRVSGTEKFKQISKLVK